MTLFARNGRSDSLVLEGRVVDPGAGVDEALRITVEDGVITRLEPGSPGTRSSPRPSSTLTSTCAHRVARTRRRSRPGRPPQRQAATARSSPCRTRIRSSTTRRCWLAGRARARRGARPDRFPRRDLEGAARRRADRDGRARGDGCRGVHGRRPARRLTGADAARAPVRGGRRAAASLHEEEPSLSRDGQMHEGAVSAELGLAGWPSVAESAMVERDVALAAYERRALHIMHVSALESVHAIRSARSRGVERDRGGHAAPPLSDRRLRAHPRRQREDEPAAAVGGPPPGARGGAPRRDDLVHRDRPRSARAPREGGAVRGGPLRRHGLETAFAALNTYLVAPGRALARRRCSSGCRRGPRACSGWPCRGSRSVSGPTSSRSIPTGWTVTEDGFRSRSVNSWLLGARLRGRVVRTVADGREVFACVNAGGAATTGYLLLEDGTVYRGRRWPPPASRSGRPSSRRR